MALEFKFAVDPDEHGVYDGRDLAFQLIGTAARVLSPYVTGCPACVDKLFSKIANDVLEQLHQKARDDGRIDGGVYTLGDQATRQVRQQQHMDAATGRTAELLGVDHHYHHGDENESSP